MLANVDTRIGANCAIALEQVAVINMNQSTVTDLITYGGLRLVIKVHDTTWGTALTVSDSVRVGEGYIGVLPLSKCAPFPPML